MFIYCLRKIKKNVQVTHFCVIQQPILETIHQAVWEAAFDLESDVRVTCDVGYLCANFSLPRPLCSRIRPDVRDRQTET